MVLLTLSPPDALDELCRYISECYRRQLFCDLHLQVPGSSYGIKCHRIVLAALLPSLKPTMASSQTDELTSILLPETHPEELQNFMDELYGSLLGRSEGDIRIPESLRDFFDLKEDSQLLEDDTNGSLSKHDFDENCARTKVVTKRKLSERHQLPKRFKSGHTNDLNHIKSGECLTLKDVYFSGKDVDLREFQEPFVFGAFQLQNDQKSLTCKSISWTNPGEDVLSHFQESTIALRDLCGVSHSNLFESALDAFKISPNYRRKAMKAFISDYSTRSFEDLKQEIDNLHLDADERMTQGIQKSSIEMNPGSYLIHVKKDIQVSECHFLGFLSLSFPTTLIKLQSDSNAFDIWEMLSVLWDPLKRKQDISRWLVQELSYKIQREAILTILNGDDDHEDSKTCPDCAECLPFRSKKDKQKYKNHIERHELMNYPCDCDISFKDPKEKRRHVMLTHLHGKYIKCEKCAFIGTRNQVRTHEESNHKAYICDVCGKQTPTKAALAVHVLDHKPYKCEICGLDIMGRHKYTRHKDTTHSGPHTCEICGNVFKAKSYLLKHISIMHQSDEKKPHQCDQCGKGFVTTNSLKTHKMNVHIRSRPYSCRYGCGAAYNDSSNRGHHERKKHGGNFDPKRLSVDENQF